MTQHIYPKWAENTKSNSRFSRTKILQIFPYSDKRMFIVNLEDSTEFRQQVNAEYTDTFTIL